MENEELKQYIEKSRQADKTDNHTRQEILREGLSKHDYLGIAITLLHIFLLSLILFLIFTSDCTDNDEIFGCLGELIVILFILAPYFVGTLIGIVFIFNNKIKNKHVKKVFIITSLAPFVLYLISILFYQ